MTKTKSRRKGGRPRRDVARQPNGQPKRQRQEITPMNALARRAAAAGINPDQIVSPSSVMALRLCQDQSAGTALGRLMWAYSSDGSRSRRMTVVQVAGEDVRQPLITDDMAAAADLYRVAWVTWHQASGLPNRNPRAMDIGRPPMGGSEAEDLDVERAARRYHRCLDVIACCDAPALVQAVLDSVVLENQDGLILDRPYALNALRLGLQAIADTLIRGVRKKT